MTYLFLADGFETIEAFATIDVLRRGNVDVKMVSINDSIEVESVQGIKIKADAKIEDLDFTDAEMLILPGGLPGVNNLEECDRLRELLIKQNEENKYIAAICAAPRLLGKLGILDNKEATCHPGYEQCFGLGIYKPVNAIVSSNIITGRSAGSSLEFAFLILETLKGQKDASDVMQKMIYKNSSNK